MITDKLLIIAGIIAFNIAIVSIIVYLYRNTVDCEVKSALQRVLAVLLLMVSTIGNFAGFLIIDRM